MPTSSAIDLLRAVILSPDCAKMNRSTVKGFLGELLVKERLESEGIEVNHLGNQNGVELCFEIGGKRVSVDVKMSLPKDEFKWGFEYWSWALLHENKKKEVAATHFVCVGCSQALEIESLFVVQKSRLAEFPRGIRQFSKVTHGLVLQRGLLPAGIEPPEAALYAISHQLLKNDAVVRVGPNQRLRDVCASLEC